MEKIYITLRFISSSKKYLKTISTVTSLCSSILFCSCVQKLTPVSAVGSQNVTNRSFLLSVKSEKYAFWVTLRPLGSMSQGEGKIHALQYSARQIRAAYIKLTSVFHHLYSVGPKQLCALAHIGFTRTGGTY